VAASSALALEDPGDRTARQSLRGHVGALTGLRGFAALNVLIVHAAFLTPYQWMGLHGYGPVALFTLSGFLLFRPFSRWVLGRAERPSIAVFARKRVARLFPAYWVVLIFASVVLPESQPSGWREWLHSLTLTETLGDGGLNPALFQAWSLGTELGWYVVLPPFAGLLVWTTSRYSTLRTPGRLALVVIVLTGLTTFAWRQLIVTQGWYDTWTYPHWVFAFLVAFGAGASLACLLELPEGVGSRRLRSMTRRPTPLLVLATVVALIGMSPLGGPHNYDPVTNDERHIRLACNVVVAAILILVVAFSDRPNWVSRALSHRGVVALGRWSYGIFLWHMSVILVLSPLLTDRRSLLGLAVWIGAILAVSVPLGAATYAWVEVPAIRWSKRAENGTGERVAADPAPAPAVQIDRPSA
jgi:peptidoglycan/LPS O-acetylase OafA/YrhL